MAKSVAGEWMANRLGAICKKMLILVLALSALAPAVKAQTPPQYGSWSGAGVSGPTAYEACKAQWQQFNSNPQSRFIGALDVAAYPNRKDCSWTTFQYLCPEETGFGIFGCGTVLPSYVEFYCVPGYRALAGQVCVKSEDDIPERPCECNNGGSVNPTVGHPFVLSTGSKILHIDDYLSADGQLDVGRHYRSLPIGSSKYFQNMPQGLAGNWIFDFSHELQFSSATGTLAQPNLGLAFVASDGTAYDFSMQSGGSMAADVTTGQYYAPKNIKVEYVGTLPDSLDTIAANSSQWRVTDADDTVWTFQTFKRRGTSSYTIGRPIAKVTRSNYRWDFMYDVDGTLQKITDSFGRQLVFTWSYFYKRALSTQESYPEAVKSVALPDGTSIRYTYDPPATVSPPSTGQIQRLVKAENIDSSSAVLRSMSYTYGNTSYPWHITSVARTDGSIIANYSYDDRGRGISTSLANNVEQYQIASTDTATEYIKSVTGPLGKVEEYRFQKFNTVTPDFRITSINGQASTTTPANSSALTYGTDAFIENMQDEEGRTTKYTRDSRGNPLTIIEALGTSDARITTNSYHPTLNLPLQSSRTGLSIAYTYDVQGRMLGMSETDTTTHTLPYTTNGQIRNMAYSWSPQGRLLSINGPLAVDALGKDDTVAFAYDMLGNVTTITNGLGQITSFGLYDANGRPGTSTDPNNIVTAFTYDLLGRTTKITRKHPSDMTKDAITTLLYDFEGRITGLTAPATDKLTMAYDVAGRLLSVSAPNGEKIAYGYDAMSNVTSQITKRSNDTTSASITRTFDSLGRMLTQSLGLNRTMAYEYDKVGNRKKATDPRSFVTTSSFDALNRLISTVTPDTGSSTAAYNSINALTSVTDAVLVTTGFVRNGFGEVIQESSPDRGTSVYYYDLAGRRVAMVDGRGQRVDYTRDILGRITKKLPVGKPTEVITYAYDSVGVTGSYGIGRLASITDATGVTKFGYDHRGNQTSKVQKIGTSASASLKYAYNLGDRITSITYPSGRSVSYSRDSKGRVSSVSTKASSAATSVSLISARTYESYGALKSATFGNGTALTQGWGNDGRLASKRLYKVSGNVSVSAFTYAYDNDDNITGITDGVAAANNVAYAYDNRGRLVRASNGVGTYARQDFVYDVNGNRTAVEWRVNGTDASPAASDIYARTAGTNRLASVTSSTGTVSPGLRSFTQDARGNLSGETRPGGINPAIGVTTSYDGYGRLSAYNRTTGITNLIMAYNGMDDRVSQSTSTGTVTGRYIYDSQGRMMGEYLASSAAADTRAEYIYLNPDAANDNPSPYGGDDGMGGYGLLSIATKDSSGAPVLHWIHSNHLGAPLLTTDSTGTVIPAGSYAQPVFPGQIQTLPDLYYNRYRDYDPTTGRYVQADPIGLAGGDNPYLYANGNPVRYTDPSGQNPVAAVLVFCEVQPLACAAIGAGIVYYGGKLIDSLLTLPGVNPICNLLARSGDSGGRSGSGGIPIPKSGRGDYCYSRWELEDSNCYKWDYLGKRAVAACRVRAQNRRNICIANKGRPSPFEPNEWDPYLDGYGKEPDWDKN